MSVETQQSIGVTQDADIATLRLNRGPVNALSVAMYEELVTLLHELRQSPSCTVIILTSGLEQVFCAGGDVKESGDAEKAAVRRVLARELFRLLCSGPQPVVCAVNGPAVGAGASIAACADIRIGSPRASFRLPEIAFGHAGGASLLKRMLPGPMVAYAALTGLPISAEEALRVGALHKIVAPDELETEVHSLAQAIAQHGKHAVSSVKTALVIGAGLDHQQGYALEQALS